MDRSRSASVCTMKDRSVMQLVPCVLFLAVTCAWLTTSATSAALRADLTHVDSGRGFTKLELLRRMAARSTARAANLYSSSSGRSQAMTAPVAPYITGGGSEYNIYFGIGTPSPQPVAVTLDTGSDLIWTQCSCGGLCFDQPFPVLDPSISGTYGAMSCSDPLCVNGGLLISGCTIQKNSCFYVYTYQDISTTFGIIAKDTFTFQAPNGTDVAVPNLRFGCGLVNHLTFRTNETGIAGFGRRPLSLPSQLNVSRFSYCFTTIIEGRASPAFLDTPDNLLAHATGPIQSTPFAPNPASSPSWYFLSLKGITVGKTRLPYNASVFALKDDGSGGTFIDSGASITSFPQAVFQGIYDAFVSQLRLPVANVTAAAGMLCFYTSPGADPKKVAVPKLILHLEGADWDLPRENYVMDVDDDNGTGLCVVINSAGESDMTTIGNFQQQNMHIVYDLEANKMVFVPARCDQL